MKDPASQRLPRQLNISQCRTTNSRSWQICKLKTKTPHARKRTFSIVFIYIHTLNIVIVYTRTFSIVPIFTRALSIVLVYICTLSIVHIYNAQFHLYIYYKARIQTHIKHSAHIYTHIMYSTFTYTRNRIFQVPTDFVYCWKSLPTERSLLGYFLPGRIDWSRLWSN